MFRSTLVSLAVLSVFVSSASAQITLFQNAPNSLTGIGGWTTSSNSNFTSGFWDFDDFTTSQAAVVKTITWRGFYWDLNHITNPPTPATDSWYVGIYSNTNNAGVDLPNTTLFASFFSTASVTRTFVGSTLFNGDTINVYDFAVNISGFQTVPGERYWLTTLSVQNDPFNPLYAWAVSSSPNGQTYSHQYQFNSGSGATYVSQRNNLTFAIIGTNAPEPASVLLAALGGVVVTSIRKRRQN